MLCSLPCCVLFFCWHIVRLGTKYLKIGKVCLKGFEVMFSITSRSCLIIINKYNNEMGSLVLRPARGGVQRFFFYVSTNRVKTSFITQIFWPIRIMERSIGPAYSVNRRLYLLLSMLENSLYKMQCFWCSPLPSELWRTDILNKEDTIFCKISVRSQMNIALFLQLK